MKVFLPAGLKKVEAIRGDLVLDPQVSAKRAETLSGWRPNRPDVLDDLRHGSYALTGSPP